MGLGLALMDVVITLSEEQWRDWLAKRDLPDAFAGAGADAVAAAVAEVHEALGALLTKAQEAGGVRRDVSVGDLIALLKGLLHAVRTDPDPDVRHRLLAVVRDGLRPKEG